MGLLVLLYTLAVVYFGHVVEAKDQKMCTRANELTTDCGGQCHALCIKYRHPKDCGDECKADDDGCKYECIDSNATEAWNISLDGVPAWNNSLRTSTQIVAIRALKVPKDVSSLAITTSCEDCSTEKGYVHNAIFPDHKIVRDGGSVSSLKFTNLNCSHIPSSAFDMDLDTLTLQNCALLKVPSYVLNQIELSTLDLSRNFMKTLPDDITTLPLEMLKLDDNRFSKFPTLLSGLSTLKRLSMRDNNITKVDLKLKKSPLEVLSLDRNSLTKLPDFGKAFPKLTTIYMNQNQISHVTGNYSTNLTKLVLRGNELTSFNASFRNLSHLDVGNNKLKKLLTLPPTLRILNATGNALTSLPKDKLISLTTLNLSNNSLQSFDMKVPSLKVLDLRANDLKELPSNILKLKHLEALYLRGNSKLKGTKISLEQYRFLSNLKKLDIDKKMFKPDGDCSFESVEGDTICAKKQSDPNKEKAVLIEDTGSQEEDDGSTTSFVAIAVIGCVILCILGYVSVIRKRNKTPPLSSPSSSPPPRKKSPEELSSMYQFSSKMASKLHSIEKDQTSSFIFNSNMMQPNVFNDPSLNAYRLNHEAIKMEYSLASGAYGEVWTAYYRNELVAVKTLSASTTGNDHALDGFVDEVKLMSRLDHPRIVRMYGATWTDKTDLRIVMEYMSKGDLHSLLQTPALPKGQWDKAKFQIAMDIMEALTYIHSLDPILIHRDLKSKNVLINSLLRAKVTDFGTACFHHDFDGMTMGVGTGRWMAPEMLLEKANYTEKVDVYSFGIILSELDTHAMPFSGIMADSRDADDDEEEEMPEYGILQMIVGGELQPSFSASCPPAIVRIAQKCFAFHPEDRPSAQKVAFWLRQAAAEELNKSKDGPEVPQPSGKPQESDKPYHSKQMRASQSSSSSTPSTKSGGPSPRRADTHGTSSSLDYVKKKRGNVPRRNARSYSDTRSEKISKRRPATKENEKRKEVPSNHTKSMSKMTSSDTSSRSMSVSSAGVDDANNGILVLKSKHAAKDADQFSSMDDFALSRFSEQSAASNTPRAYAI